VITICSSLLHAELVPSVFNELLPETVMQRSLAAHGTRLTMPRAAHMPSLSLNEITKYTSAF